MDFQTIIDNEVFKWLSLSYPKVEGIYSKSIEQIGKLRTSNQVCVRGICSMELANQYI